MALREFSAVIGVMAESSAYTFLEPTAAYTFPAFDCKYAPEFKAYQRKETSTDFGKSDDVMGQAGGEISFGICLQGHTSGAGNAPYYADALLACGLKETIVAATSVTYNPTMEEDGGTGAGYREPSLSYTVCKWVDSTLRMALKGCRGSFKLVARAGEPIELLFNFKGAYYTMADDAPPTPTLTALTPPKFTSAGLTMFSAYAPAFESFEFDMGNELLPVIDANDTLTGSGLKGYRIGNRRMVGSVDPEAALVATHPFFATWLAGTSGAIGTGVIGGTAGNRVEINCARTQYTEISEGSRNGALTFPTKFSLKVGSGYTTEASLLELIYT